LGFLYKGTKIILHNIPKNVFYTKVKNRDGTPFVNEYGTRYLLSTYTNDVHAYWKYYISDSKIVIDENYKNPFYTLEFEKEKNGQVWSDDTGNLYEEYTVSDS
jgi:hypothetical protein